MDLNQDWKKAMEEAGCTHMSYIKKVRKECIRKPEGWAYYIIAVYLEKKYPSGLLLRCKVEVDVELLKIQERPELFLCDEVSNYIKGMDRQAGIDEEVGSENNQSD